MLNHQQNITVLLRLVNRILIFHEEQTFKGSLNRCLVVG